MREFIAFALVCCLSPVLATAEGKGDLKKEWALLKGDWQALAMKVDGQQVPKNIVKAITITFSEGSFVSTQTALSLGQGKLELNPAQKPKEMTLIAESVGNSEKRWLAIYEVKADTL